jgi:hypothetical protein
LRILTVFPAYRQAGPPQVATATIVVEKLLNCISCAPFVPAIFSFRKFRVRNEIYH